MKRWLIITVSVLIAVGLLLPSHRLIAQSSATFAVPDSGFLAAAGAASATAFSVRVAAGQVSAGSAASANYGMLVGIGGNLDTGNLLVFLPALMKNHATGW